MGNRRIIAFLVPMCAAAAAHADVSFSVGGLAGTGVTADVTFGYTAINATSGTISIDITNTTPDSGDTAGSRITAFGFNVPGGFTITSIGGDVDDAGTQMVTALSAPNESGWYGRYDLDNIDTPNGAGDFDFGVMNSDNVQAFITDGVGTASSPRIDAGETTSFTLGVIGSGLGGLAEDDFLNALSVDGPAGAFNFAVRFQGIGPDDESDLAVVPVPGSVALCFAGFGGLGVFRAVRRRLGSRAAS